MCDLQHSALIFPREASHSPKWIHNKSSNTDLGKKFVAKLCCDKIEWIDILGLFHEKEWSERH